jgi:hypothetical protein
VQKPEDEERGQLGFAYNPYSEFGQQQGLSSEQLWDLERSRGQMTNRWLEGPMVNEAQLLAGQKLGKSNYALTRAAMGGRGCLSPSSPSARPAMRHAGLGLRATDTATRAKVYIERLGQIIFMFKKTTETVTSGRSAFAMSSMADEYDDLKRTASEYLKEYMDLDIGSLEKEEKVLGEHWG